jgi:hypothetical protein
LSARAQAGFWASGLLQCQFLACALTGPHHVDELIVGKVAGELWASEKNESQAAIARGILGELR